MSKNFKSKGERKIYWTIDDAYCFWLGVSAFITKFMPYLDILDFTTFNVQYNNGSSPIPRFIHGFFLSKLYCHINALELGSMSGTPSARDVGK